MWNPRLSPLVGLEFSFSRQQLCRVVSLGDISISPGFCALFFILYLSGPPPGLFLFQGPSDM